MVNKDLHMLKYGVYYQKDIDGKDFSNTIFNECIFYLTTGFNNCELGSTLFKSCIIKINNKNINLSMVESLFDTDKYLVRYSDTDKYLVRYSQSNYLENHLDITIYKIAKFDAPFIGYKKCELGRAYEYKTVIVKLEISPEDRYMAFNQAKCRCEKAKVLDIYDYDGVHYKTAQSMLYTYFRYKLGEYAIPDYYDDNTSVECSHGIHFFLEEEDAREFGVF